MANKTPSQNGLIDYRKQRQIDTQNKIIEAFESIKRSNKKMSINSVAKKAGVSTVTVYKYHELAEKIKGFRDGIHTKRIKKRSNVTVNQLEIINQGLEMKIEELKRENEALRKRIEVQNGELFALKNNLK
ncbi:hypothetical protein ACJDU8_25200 [Clostridium sp. WILCCON 0269]|uniref:Transposase n=1 Tax=Candidatus Clostridium eludens TaxID=3381663 RepID=A0ABW8SSQ5_9CLOT